MVFVLVQAVAAWYMVGTIWTMQILNYPLLARIDPAGVPRYEQAHNRRFGIVVGPGVAAALVSTLGVQFDRPAPIGWAAPTTTAALLLVIIASTVAGQARAHARLAERFDAAVHAALVRGNWIRTGAWTAIAALDLWMITQLLTAR